MPTIVVVLMFLPGIVVLVAATVKLREYWLARAYAVTKGKVLISKIESRRRTGTSSKPVVENFPKVVFEYQVDGKKLRGERISIGEQAGNYTVETTLERYAVGREVEIYYDPKRPDRAVLERDLPPVFWQGMLIAIGVFFGGPLFLAYAFTDLPAKIASSLPHPGRAVVVVGGGIATLFLGGIAAAMWKQFLAERRYVAANGRIVESTTVAYDTVLNGVMRKMYRANIVYAYRVGKREYRGNNLRTSVDVSKRGASSFASLLARYPVGREVAVWHDAVEPSNSVLKRSGLGPHVMTVFALLAIAVLLHGLGVFPN